MMLTPIVSTNNRKGAIVELENDPKNISGSGTPKDWLGESGQIMALGMASCYISGFLIVNSYLGKYGLKDYDAFRTEYLVAGVLFFILIGFWYFFVGRKLPKLDTFSSEFIKRYESLGGTGKYWRFIGFITPGIDLAQSFVMLVVLTAIIFFSYQNQLIYTLFGISVFVGFWAYSVESSKASESVTKWFYLLLLIADLAVVLMFILLMDELLIVLSGFFIVLTFGMIMNIDIERYVKDSALKHTVSIYLLVTVLIIGSGVAFGINLYENVKASLGGAKPPIVRVVVGEDIPAALARELEIVGGISTTFKLLAQSDKELYLLPQSGNNHITIRVSRDLIKAVVSQNEKLTPLR